jgi:K+-transporting ATPase ATPase C chain
MVKTALKLFLILTVLTGLIYPLVVTGIAQALFSWRANGSRTYHQGVFTGSALIGRHYDKPEYFWGRLSATSGFPYNSAASSGSNYGPHNPLLRSAMEERRAKLLAADPGNSQPIPIDLLTASASGLDAHISPEAARYQAPRVARLRGMAPEQVSQIIERCTEPRQFGIFGEPVVSVVALNEALDGR